MAFMKLVVNVTLCLALVIIGFGAGYVVASMRAAQIVDNAVRAEQLSTKSIQEAEQAKMEAKQAIKIANQKTREANRTVEIGGQLMTELNQRVNEANQAIKAANQITKESNQAIEEANRATKEANQAMENVIKSQNLPRYVQWPGAVVHHSGSDTSTVAGMDADHKSRGWNGIGYHIVIDTQGKITYTYRFAGHLVGAHCKGHNDRLGICMIGNFDKRLPAPEALAALGHVIRAHVKGRVVGHCELGHTICPGKCLYEWIVEQRKNEWRGEP